jgi:response regulator of citrate/malate metabolism
MTATLDSKKIANLNGIEPADYLIKPFEFKDLLGLLNKFFNQTTNQ